MSRNIFLVLLIIGLAIGTNLFFSCSKVDNDDTNPPSIEVLTPVDGDTLFIYTDTDTAFNVFYAICSDDIGLSSYTFRLRYSLDHDSSRLAPYIGGDTTAYLNRNYQKEAIFGKTRDTIDHRFLIDSMVNVINKVNKKSKSYPIQEGKYILEASVVDINGNIDSIKPLNIVIAKTKHNK